MLIVCPICASTYTISPHGLGAAGRRVRCAACRSDWFVSPGDAFASSLLPASQVDRGADVRPVGDSVRVVERADATPTANLPAVANTASQHRPRARDRAGRDVIAALARSRHERKPDAGGRPPSLARPRPQSERRRSNRLAGSLRTFGAAAAGVAAIAAIGAGVFAREEMVRFLPGAARLYTGVGFPVNPRGLEFRGVRSELTTEAENATLVVEGEIANVVRRGRVVPPVTVAIRNTAGHPLYTWTLDPPRHRLDAGQSVPFRSRVATPPAEGFDVVVRFGKAPDRLADAR